MIRANADSRPTLKSIPDATLPAARHASRPAAPHHGWAALTRAELRVANLVAEGLTNRAAAAQLSVSPHTVDSHLRNIFAKLGISSRVALVRLAVLADLAA
ncbi:helix-turn-helix transcriptional regulator [Streptomyces sp. NPDC001828]|uniref:helix-turn-helix domain-containing protein n=1 Tax=Streptomyces sp. NPDC001828 TaxID=3364615 RepID=UPI003691E65C